MIYHVAASVGFIFYVDDMLCRSGIFARLTSKCVHVSDFTFICMNFGCILNAVGIRSGLITALNIIYTQLYYIEYHNSSISAGLYNQRHGIDHKTPRGHYT